MASTEHRGYYFPSPLDLIRNFPAPQQASLEAIDSDMHRVMSAVVSPSMIGDRAMPYELAGGWHQQPLGTDTVNEANGYPPGEDRGYVLALTGDDKGKTARWYFGSKTGRIWAQERYGTTAAWGDWRLVTPAPGGAAGGGMGTDGPHRKAEMIKRHGGQIGTGGRGVVALRFDHQNPDFQTKILPLLKARGLPYTHAQYALALSPTQENGYAGDEQAGLTWDQVQQASLHQGGEIFSHSYTHGDTTDYAREIVGSRDYLEQQMPEIRVEGFAQPGIGGSAWGGMALNLHNPAQWRDYEAGRLIRDSYGLYTGSGPLYNPLTGDGADGITHTVIESVSSASSSKNIIDGVTQLGYGAVLMLHPNRVDEAGGITTATLVEILDYLVQARDAGRVMVLTMSGLSVASTHHATRSNILEGTDFDLTRWQNTTGWTAADGVASTTTGGVIRRPWAPASTSWALGGAREASVEMRAPQGAVVRIQVRDYTTPSKLTTTRDVTLPASEAWVTVRQPFLIPRTTVGLHFDAGRVSGGPVEMRNPGLFAI